MYQSPGSQRRRAPRALWSDREGFWKGPPSESGAELLPATSTASISSKMWILLFGRQRALHAIEN